MYKNLLITCLLVAAASNYYLTPAFPPTAYQNQFYNVRFRVRGLDDPVFTFEGLPKSLSGNAAGVISGIPAQAGSVSITIKYRSGALSGSKNVILRTLENTRKTQTIVQATNTRIGLVIEYPGTLIFRVGQAISIPLVVKNGLGSLVWSFFGLPTGIKGSSKLGLIEGSISQAGYYNLQVQCGDQEGKSGQAFFTVNIQPINSMTSSKVVDVKTKSSSTFSSLITYDKIEVEQLAAINELFKALNIVGTRKNIVADVKQHVAVATLRVNNAQASFNTAEAACQQAINDRQFTRSLLSSTQSALNAAQKNLELALTEQTQATARLNEARKAVQDAQKRFNAAQKAVKDTEDALVQAKDKMQRAEAALRDAKTQKSAAQEEYNRAFDALQAARTQLEDAKARKQKVDQAVKAAKDALELTQQARDDADNDLKKADFNLVNAQKQLDSALKKVSLIRERYTNASAQFSSTKWQWQMVINRLYVVQARKQTADRASAIALAQGSLSDHNLPSDFNSIGGSINLGTSSSASFLGCDARRYPVISGTSRVVSLNAGGFKLASGQSVLYGPCSAVAKSVVGDYVNYNGYVVNGVINALRIERVLLS